jgi:hypothetical protein
MWLLLTVLPRWRAPRFRRSGFGADCGAREWVFRRTVHNLHSRPFQAIPAKLRNADIRQRFRVLDYSGDFPETDGPYR